MKTTVRLWGLKDIFPQLKNLEQILNKFLVQEVFTPLKVVNKVSQNRDVLLNAILNNKIFYTKDQIFTGEFSPKVIEELNQMNAMYDAKLGGYYIAYRMLPLEVKNMINKSSEQTNNMYIKMIDNIDRKLELFNQTNIMLKKSFLEQAENIFNKFNQSYYKELIIPFLLKKWLQQDKTLTKIQLKEKKQAYMEKRYMTDQILFKNKLQKEYADNLEIKIKNVSSDSLLKIRNTIAEAVQNGSKIANLKDIISTQLQVSRTRAEYLAREETRLFLGKYQVAKFKSVGQKYFKWIHTDPRGIRTNPRDGHVMLFERSKRGEIFNFDNPPEDPITHRKTLPQLEINCHCVAQVIVDEKELAKYLQSE